MSVERDKAVIDRLIELGADLSEPRDVEHFLVFNEEQAAQAAAAELGDYDTSVVSRDDEAEPWGVAAVKRLVVSMESIADERQRLSAVAQRHGGEYDGWGTEA